MTKWINRPYPFIFGEKSVKYKICAFVFAFVFGFLLIFTPFNLKETVSINFELASLIYAIISTIVVFLYMTILPKLLPKYLNEKNWTIGREFLMMNGLLILITVSNVFVCKLTGFHLAQIESLWDLFLLEFLHTYAIGIFPVMVISFLNYTIQLKRNNSKVDALNLSISNREDEEAHEPMLIEIISAHNNNRFKLNLDELLFIMSDGNYVEFHLEKDKGFEREIQRNTLANIVSQLSGYDFLFQSHRAYVVNLNKVSSSSGNAQGYQLKFDNLETTVPVSRRNLAKFDQLING